VDECCNEHLAGSSKGKALDLYSEGMGFETRLGYRLTWLRFFVVFSSLFTQNTKIGLRSTSSPPPSKFLSRDFDHFAISFDAM